MQNLMSTIEIEKIIEEMVYNSFGIFTEEENIEFNILFSELNARLPFTIINECTLCCNYDSIDCPKNVF